MQFHNLSQQVQRLFVYGLMGIAHNQKRQLNSEQAKELLLRLGDFYYDRQVKNWNLTNDSRDLLQTHIITLPILSDEDVLLNEAIKIYFISNEEKTYLVQNLIVSDTNNSVIYNHNNLKEPKIPFKPTEQSMLQQFHGYRIHSLSLIESAPSFRRVPEEENTYKNIWHKSIKLSLSDSTDTVHIIDLYPLGSLANIYDKNVRVTPDVSLQLENFPIYDSISTNQDNYFLIEINIVKG